MRGSVGIRDVAEAAGVSVTTVSHVLNDTPHTRTSEATKERVREVALQLGYRPNRMARGLRTQRSGMIGLLTEEIATTPHAGGIILGAQNAASGHNVTMTIINSAVEADERTRRADIEALVDAHADGIIHATVYQESVSLPPEFSDKAVLVGARDRAMVIPSVIPNEKQGAIDVVRLLVEQGHRRIGFANSSRDVPATRGRLEGYLEGLGLVGIPYDPSLVVDGDSEAAGGYLAALRLLDRPDRPSALFCYNDRMAMGAYRAAAELGLTIPDDVSIVGFDDQDPIAGSMFPGLTTVALPHYEMGYWAVTKLMEIIRGEYVETPLSGQPTLLACPLVLRGSVGAPR